MTGLIDELRETIALEGPITIARYMTLCLAHPLHGYYVTRDPLGQAGDFTTAPEISQMFGELLGLWAAGVWDGFGRPTRLRLVELGPGRGTLMADALRAARALPPFRDALAVHLVEISPALRQRQQERLAAAGVPVVWHERIEDVPAGGAEIVLANEFFDALPIHQFVFAGGHWRERLVGLDAAGRLCFGLSDAPVPVPFGAANEGDIRELCPAGIEVVRALVQRWQGGPGALLALDYGYARPRAGDSFQALKGHRFADVLADPGTADLTAHVDFSALAQAARAAGLVPAPLLTQATLLARLGLAGRVAALSRANPGRGEEVATAAQRLAGTGAEEMGLLFKALAVATPGAGALPAFDSADPLLDNLGS